MPDFYLNLDQLTCVSSSFGPGADEIVLQSRLMDISAKPYKDIKSWDPANGPWSLNTGGQILGKPLWHTPVPANPFPDKIQLDVVMQKVEAFLQSSVVNIPNNHGTVNITFTAPTIPGLAPASVNVSGNPLKALGSLIFENDNLGHWTAQIDGAGIKQLQAGGIIYLHTSGQKSFGKWGSEFIIEYKLLVM
jgi:hypothetical protein